MSRKVGGLTLHRFIMRENAWVGGLKRWCAKCGEHVQDQGRTRSKFCRDCRQPNPLHAEGVSYE